MKLARESVLLIVICLVDALSTYWLIQGGRATEMNPVMNWVLGYGWSPFFIVKAATVGLAVGFAEWCRRYDNDFARKWMRLTVWLYLSVWTVGILLGYMGDLWAG